MIRALVIIEASYLSQAREMLQMSPFDQSPEQAAESFVPMGSLTGNEPATHYWLSAMFRPEAWETAQKIRKTLTWANCFSYENSSFPFSKRKEMKITELHKK